jgi:hypothetical protein
MTFLEYYIIYYILYFMRQYHDYQNEIFKEKIQSETNWVFICLKLLLDWKNIFSSFKSDENLLKCIHFSKCLLVLSITLT